MSSKRITTVCVKVNAAWMFAVVCSTVISVSAQTWTRTSAPVGVEWQSVASSADGTKLVGSIFGSGAIYTSTNSGATWLESSNASNFGSASVAGSADGSKLVTEDAYLDEIYTSTNAGFTWEQIPQPAPTFDLDWFAVASSADGRILAAASYGSYIYISTNSGLTLVKSGAPNGYWRWVACSADGSKLAGVDSDSRPGDFDAIYTSTNLGTSWTQAPFIQNAFRVACSADGNNLVAIAFPGFIYTSTNFGATWRQTSAPSNSWYSVASSADGTKLIAGAAGPGPIYSSTDAGATWTSNNIPNGHWYSVASSADGNEFLAADDGGGIWEVQTAPSPRLNMTSANDGLVISWLVPSANFRLQQSPDLNIWSSITNAQVLNLTNLQYHFGISPANVSRFYRLATQ